MHRLAKALVAALVGVAVVLAGTASASAHTGDQSYLYLDIGEELGARFQMPFGDVDDALGIDLFGSEDETAEAIEEHADELRDYAASHVELGDGTTTWPMVPGEVSRVEDIDYVEVSFSVDTGGPVPDGVTVTFDPFFDEIADRDALMLVGNDWKRGVVDSEADQLVRLTPNARTASVEFGDASQWKNFTASLELGVDHIRTGPDHMLFVVALLLPSVLIWRSGWLPAESFGSSLWRLTKVLTMFTLAHSITFSLAGLGVVPTPGPKVTESIIALSIAATAAHNLRPVILNREWVIALAFGLFHGFGFASLVDNLEVSRATELVSLAGRNVGIEIGQLVVVLLTFPAVFLLRATRYYRPFFVAGSITLIVVSFGWAIERVFGGTTLTSDVVDKITKFPRVLILLAIGTAISAGLYWYERSKGRLLTGDTAEDDSAEKEFATVW